MQPLRDQTWRGFQNLPNTGSVDISSLVHFKAVQSRGLSAKPCGVQETKNVMLIIESFDPKYLKGDTDKINFWTLLHVMLDADFVIVLITNSSKVILRNLGSNSYCEKKNPKPTTSPWTYKHRGKARNNQKLSINRNTSGGVGGGGGIQNPRIQESRIFLRRGCYTKEWCNWLVRQTNFKSC